MPFFIDLSFDISSIVINFYNKDKVAGLKFISECGVPKIAMSDIYKILVKDKTILPIEDLSWEEKTELVNECKSAGIFYEPKNYTSLCGILHAIKTINANS